MPKFNAVFCQIILTLMIFQTGCKSTNEEASQAHPSSKITHGTEDYDDAGPILELQINNYFGCRSAAKPYAPNRAEINLSPADTQLEFEYSSLFRDFK
jgi:hypothetical protein